MGGSGEVVVAGGKLQNDSFTVDSRVSSKVHKVLRRGSGVMVRLAGQYLVSRFISGWLEVTAPRARSLFKSDSPRWTSP
jgi:hypothetical protein